MLQIVELLRHHLVSSPPNAFQIEDNLEDSNVLASWAAVFRRARDTARYRSVFRKEEPLVSVCIATADRPSILAERALSSMREQTYRNLEVIIVGDQCDSETELMVRKFADARFKYFNVPVRGPYPRPGLHRWMVAGTNPMNFALKHATGDLITHLDEDDTYVPARVEVLVEELKRTEADLVFHPFYRETEDRSLTKVGNGNFELGQTGTGLIFYHQWLGRIPWNVYAYRYEEPGDWNRLKKVKAMGAKLHYVDRMLSWHWKYPLRGEFVSKPGETFLD